MPDVVLPPNRGAANLCVRELRDEEGCAAPQIHFRPAHAARGAPGVAGVDLDHLGFAQVIEDPLQLGTGGSRVNLHKLLDDRSLACQRRNATCYTQFIW